MLWEPCDWESEHFGVRVARLAPAAREEPALRQALAEIDDWRGAAVHWLLPADDDAAVRLAELHGFHLVDVRLTLDWRPANGTKTAQSASAGIRSAVAADLPELVAIARGAYHLSRFYFDGGFPADRCDDLYEAWLRRSWREAPESLLVAARAGRIAGFIAGRVAADRASGRIELLGVAADHREEGIATGLVRRGQEHLVAAGARSVEVVTQGRNVAAQRAYQAKGFRTAKVELWYHAWRRSPLPDSARATQPRPGDREGRRP